MWGSITWFAVRVVQCGALWYIVSWFLSRWWCIALFGRIVIETKKEKNREGGLGVGGVAWVGKDTNDSRLNNTIKLKLNNSLKYEPRRRW